MNILDNLKQLNSECFIYENYESDWWTLLDLDFEQSLNVKLVMDAVKKYAIGYCESSRVQLRPKSDCYSVMFEKNGLKFWFHIQKWEFEYEEEVYENR
jgi:hypothetical protein